MKIVFLDFDGVLNTWATRVRDGKNYWTNPCAPEFVRDLNDLVTRSNADVVISSTWRTKGRTACAGYLNASGFKGRVIDITDQLGTDRGLEIQAWLDRGYRGQPVESFVILDDNSDMAHLLPKLVQTDDATGLTGSHVEAALRLLGVDA